MHHVTRGHPSHGRSTDDFSSFNSSRPHERPFSTASRIVCEQVTLVGHADPRGSEAYNYELAARRAQAEADYLLGKGVPDTQLWVESRGELDANGETEAEWELDRNVLTRDRGEAQASNWSAAC